MANLIVCCDGTWNTPDQRENGLPAATNVVKLYRAVAPVDDEGVAQKTYYHPGVGTDGGRLARLLGGGLGRGLSGNVKSAYSWLAYTYRPGDNIFLFGFSRGAYTVRSAAGMIANCGLLDLSAADQEAQAGWDAVDAVFDLYRSKTKAVATPDRRFFHAAEGEDPGQQTPIHFLGVWDTVGALGIPPRFASWWTWGHNHFHDTRLGTTVKNARHAVAIDERREDFLPTLWSNAATHGGAKQVWFPGVHGDVGGGYSTAELSDGPLAWMLVEAHGKGLALRPGVLGSVAVKAAGIMHDSRTGVFRHLPTRPRPVPSFDDVKSFHDTATGRQASPGMQYGEYWPRRLCTPGTTAEFRVFAADPWNHTGLYLQKGCKYHFTARGSWQDLTTKCDPDGIRFRLDVGLVGRMLSSGFGWTERLWRRIFGNPAADLRITRRRDDLRWFCLCGAIANGGVSDTGDGPQRHESFLIGKDTTYVPQQSGWLFCFANDAWCCYGNNRGSVQVTVEAL